MLVAPLTSLSASFRKIVGQRPAWAALNERQQHYLLVLYRADQAAEAENKARLDTGARARPTAEWRWLRHSYVNVHPGAPRGTLQAALDGARRRDQGAGATFAVLERAGLIQTRHDELSAAAAQAMWCRDDTYRLSRRRIWSGSRPTCWPASCWRGHRLG